MNLLDILDRPIAFHRPLVTITGSVHAALMLSQAIYWSRRTSDKAGWFYKTQDDWRAETGLTRAEQESARKHLRKSKCWEERYERLEHRMWYKVIPSAISAMLKSSIGECVNPAAPNAEIQHSTNSKTTSETTVPETASPLVLEPEPPAKKKHKIGHVNGSHPCQATIETFCVGIGLPKLDGELMMMKWDADGWPKNWMDKIRYWKRRGFMPSQQDRSERVVGYGRRGGARPVAPPVYFGPKGWEQWLESKPEYLAKMKGRPFTELPEFMRLECNRDLKAKS